MCEDRVTRWKTTQGRKGDVFDQAAAGAHLQEARLGPCCLKGRKTQEGFSSYPMK